MDAFFQSQPSEPSGASPAWPLLLSKEQLAVYLAMSADTVESICPVPPLELGVRLLRWRRPDIDAWVASLPFRLWRTKTMSKPTSPSEFAGEERRVAAVERAQRRAFRTKKTSRDLD